MNSIMNSIDSARYGIDSINPMRVVDSAAAHVPYLIDGAMGPPSAKPARNPPENTSPAPVGVDGATCGAGKCSTSTPVASTKPRAPSVTIAVPTPRSSSHQAACPALSTSSTQVSSGDDDAGCR